VREYEPDATFDVIIIDRTLHMLSDVNDRIMIIERCADWLTDSGHILIADEPKNIRVFADWFAADSRSWQQTPKMKPGFCFVQKIEH